MKSHFIFIDQWDTKSVGFDFEMTTFVSSNFCDVLSVKSKDGNKTLEIEVDKSLMRVFTNNDRKGKWRSLANFCKLGSITDAVWSPDTRYLLITSAYRKLESMVETCVVVNVRSTRDLLLHQGNNAMPCVVMFSEDSRYIAMGYKYRMNMEVLTIFDVKKKDYVKLTGSWFIPSSVDFLTWSLCGQYLAFISGRFIMVGKITEQGFQKVFETDRMKVTCDGDHYASMLSFTPDSRYLTVSWTPYEVNPSDSFRDVVQYFPFKTTTRIQK